MRRADVFSMQFSRARCIPRARGTAGRRRPLAGDRGASRATIEETKTAADAAAAVATDMLHFCRQSSQSATRVGHAGTARNATRAAAATSQRHAHCPLPTFSYVELLDSLLGCTPGQHRRHWAVALSFVACRAGLHAHRPAPLGRCLDASVAGAWEGAAERRLLIKPRDAAVTSLKTMAEQRAVAILALPEPTGGSAMAVADGYTRRNYGGEQSWAGGQ